MAVQKKKGSTIYDVLYGRSGTSSSSYGDGELAQKNLSLTSSDLLDDIKRLTGMTLPQQSQNSKATNNTGGNGMAGTKPDFKVGDIVSHETFIHTNWRILKVNASGTYRCEPVGHSSYVDDTFSASSITLVEARTPKIEVDFDSVVIADGKRQQILQALEQIHQADLIFKKWGFGETIEKGKGVSMLFYGPPGTGKTLMAQAIATKLKSKLKVIAAADIESSAPGEAERNIRKHFKDAGSGKTILLFDECDSLLYSRAGVGPILAAQINELLSQLERFDGVTVFTTNRLGSLDEAVNRRLALKLEFDMPDQAERAEIWKRMFPVKAPLAKDVDFMRLAIIEITGGYIKNAVLRAARMAAVEDKPDKDKQISMSHLVQAITLETESMIDFEDAREEWKGGDGYVERSATGGNIVRGRG